MKAKVLVLSFVAIVFMVASTSCGKVIDVQIAALEKSIDKLDEEYKDMTPNEIKKAIDLIEKQIDALEEREDDMTKEQRKEFSNLNGRYTKLLVKIQLYLWAQELFDTEEVESTIEYIKGLLGANASGLLSE